MHITLTAKRLIIDRSRRQPLTPEIVASAIRAARALRPVSPDLPLVLVLSDGPEDSNPTRYPLGTVADWPAPRPDFSGLASAAFHATAGAMIGSAFAKRYRDDAGLEDLDDEAPELEPN